MLNSSNVNSNLNKNMLYQTIGTNKEGRTSKGIVVRSLEAAGLIEAAFTREGYKFSCFAIEEKPHYTPRRIKNELI